MRHAVRTAWLAVVLEIALAYAGFVAPLRAREAALRARIAAVELQMRHDRIVARQLTQIRALRTQVDAALARIARLHQARSTAALIGALTEQAARHRVAVLRIAPDAGAGDTATDETGSAGLTVAMRGRYRALLTTIAALSERLPLEVTGIALRDERTPGDGRLRVTVHARVLRRRMLLRKGNDHDSGPTHA